MKPAARHVTITAIPQVQEFGPEAKLLYRVAACGGSDPLPANASAKIVDRHCKELLAAVEEYKRCWLAVAMPFIAKVVPAGLPTHVVYPYAGGDLVTALAVYPEALEFTRFGTYLKELRQRFPGEVVIDMLCLLRIEVELSIQAKGVLIARDAGVEMPVHPDAHSAVEEIRQLRESIGRTGLLALAPVHVTTDRDDWHRYLLTGRAG
jgi:hypothetical protein